MKITRVSFWTLENSDYSEGSHHRPLRADTLGKPELGYSPANGIHPARGKLFSEMSLPIPFHDLECFTYMRVETLDADGVGSEYFGWIDSVEMVSDSDVPNTLIRWHVDLWMTWIEKVTFGSGMILRAKYTPTNPFLKTPQPYPMAFWRTNAGSSFEVDDLNPIYSKAKRVWWCYFTYTHNNTAGMSVVDTGCFPFAPDLKLFVESDRSGGRFVTCPRWTDIVAGKLEEVLGLDPKAIVSIFVGLFPPNVWNTVPGDSAGDLVVRMAGWYGTATAGTGSGVKAFLQLEDPLVGLPDNSTKGTYGHSVETTDTVRWEIHGYDSEVIGSVPWGIRITDITWRVVIGTSCYVQIRGTGPDVDLEGAHAAGCCWTIPMIPINLTDNALSSYVYSGARQADLDQIKLEADRARVGAHLGVVNSAIGGAIGGAMTGNMIGAGAGALLGSVSNIVTTELAYGYATGEFRDRDIGIRDYRAAHQTNGLLMQGDFYDFLAHGQPIRFVEIDGDTLSVQQRAQDIDQYGAHLHNWMQPNISAGGPFKIEDLTVRGQIPSQAREFIRRVFAAGVYIDV